MNKDRDFSARLLEYLQPFYTPNEFPALHGQYLTWQKTRPFAGCHILEGTPLFRNTLTKYLALLAGGANLTVSANLAIPYDPAIAELLPQFGIKRANSSSWQQGYDIVMDCAGIHAKVPSRCGYVELTRSGLERYQGNPTPVFLADEGQCKIIETSLGTGEGFLRAMQKLGHRDWKNKTIVIFGAGKVGCGIAFYCRKAGANAYLVDDSTKIAPPSGIKLLDWQNFCQQETVLANASCIVTATGIAGALSEHPLIPGLLGKPVLLANMGVEDEFGKAVPDKTRILNKNRPLNFILEEPTRLAFIDPTMALCNQALLELLQGKLQSGLNRPTIEQEQKILQTISKDGCLTQELEWLPKIRSRNHS